MCCGEQGGHTGEGKKIRTRHATRNTPVRMKALTRAYLWWPGMDRDIEQCVKLCKECQSLRKMPLAAPPHPWVRPDHPWSRVHIDYPCSCSPLTYLEVARDSTRPRLPQRSNCKTLGLHEVIVSDKATTFTSEEFTEFLKQNGICHVRSAPYHPASNREGGPNIQGQHETSHDRISGNSALTVPVPISHYATHNISLRIDVGQKTSFTTRFARTVKVSR